jgi:hypothetical protein
MLKSGLAGACLLLASSASGAQMIISGTVSADGTVAHPSSLYTVLHPSKGRYEITFTNPITPRASCIATVLGNDPNLYVINIYEGETRCVILTGNNGFRRDQRFSFIAVPESQ